MITVSMDACVAVAAVLLLLIVGIALVVALRGRAERCANCGAKLPGDTTTCPACRHRPGSEPTATPYGLIALEGPLGQSRFPIPPEGLTIGRLPDNDVVLAGELMVSRHHAVIVPEGGQYVLYDRDSANGTWVNDERVFQHVLRPGDRIQIWQSHFAFGRPDGPLPSPPPTPVQASTVHVVGESFEGYCLEGIIGRGGMSEVFRARDPQGQTVAIKILQQTDPYLVSKFVQEGNSVGPLLRGHPNIVYVYKFGQSADNRLYLVMEFVDAPSLRTIIQTRLKGRQFQESQVREIIGQACIALAYAHQNNVIHRDIKPENILVTPEGKVKVLDFGIAKLTSAATVTRNKIVGTPEYISPEQARGDPTQPASDVYSLGIVLYEMLAGSVPFPRPRNESAEQAAMEVLRQHLNERPEPIRKRNPNVQVSKQLERVTMQALKKSIKDRYKTASEMGRALGYEPVLSTVATPAAPEGSQLTILQGPRKGQKIAVPEQGLVLGRFDFGSSNAAISRRHASISFRGSSFWLEDMSRNGTWVDNQRVYGEVPLRDGAKIAIGDNLLRLDQGA